MRPLWALRYLVRFGESMALPLRLVAVAPRRPVAVLAVLALRRVGWPSWARLSCAIGSCAMISPLKTQTLTPQVP